MDALLLVVAALLQAGTTANPPIIPQGGEGWLGWIVRNIVPLSVAMSLLRWWMNKEREQYFSKLAELETHIGLEKGLTVKTAIDRVGERVNDLHTKTERVQEAQRMLEESDREQSKRSDRVQQDFGSMRQLLQESITSQSASTDRLLEAIHQGQREAAERDSKVRERLAAVESRGDVGAAIERGFALQGEALKQLVTEMREERRRRES